MPDASLYVGVPPGDVPQVSTAAFQRADGVFLQQVEEAVAKMASLLSPPRALQYARDSADRMRVSVDTGTTTVGAVRWANYSIPAAWYGDGAPNSMDERELQREMTLQTFQGQRSRWTIT